MLASGQKPPQRPEGHVGNKVGTLQRPEGHVRKPEGHSGISHHVDVDYRVLGTVRLAPHWFGAPTLTFPPYGAISVVFDSWLGSDMRNTVAILSCPWPRVQSVRPNTPVTLAPGIVNDPDFGTTALP